MQHFHPNVPGLGNVAISRHAQARAEAEQITEAEVVRALFHPVGGDIPDGQQIVWRQSNGVRLVIILNPEPNRGARLVKTIYRVKPQARPYAT